MLRQTLRAVFMLAVLVIGITSSLVATQVDATYPSGTDYAFGLDFRQSPASKSDIIAGLESFADDTDSQLLRVYSTWEDGETKNYIITFGSAADDLASESNTEVKPSSEVTTEDLSGNWALTACSTCTTGLRETVTTLGGTVTWFETKSVYGLIKELGNSGSGLAAASVAVLLFSLALLWNSSMARSRKIRTVNGSSKSGILVEDSLDIARILAPAVLLAGAIGVLYGVLPRTPTWTLTYFQSFVPLLVVLVAGFLVVNAVIGAVAFSAETVAHRRNHRERNMTILAVSARIIALILVSISIPMTVSAFTSARAATNEAHRWSVAEDALHVTNSVLVLDDNEAYIERFTPFINEIGEQDAAALAVTIDEFVEMPAATLGEFDHLVMVDPAYLELMDIPSSDLHSLDATLLPANLQATLSETLEFWSADGRLDYSLFTWAGSEPFPTLGQVAADGNAALATSPLIVVVHSPFTQIESSGFLEAFVSNGQIVFTDAEALNEAINEYELGPYIASIDLLADQLSQTASSFELQSQLALVAAITAIVSFIVIVIESAHAWAAREKRMIFARVTDGQSPWAIMRTPLTFELLTLAAAVGLTFALSAVSLHIPTGVLVASVAGLALIFVVGAVVAYRRSITASFASSIQRKN